jgi:signal transduction histidine kinase
MFFDFQNFSNFDLLTIGIVVAATCLLGFIVFLNNKNSITNRTFLYFSIITAIWGVINYFSYNFIQPTVLIWLFRFVLFFAVFQTFFLYRFFLVFPSVKYVFSNTHKYFLIPAVLFVAFLTLTPYVFKGILGIPVLGDVAVVTKGFGILFFAVLAVGLVVKSLYVLYYKIVNSPQGSERKALKLILIGVSIMFLCIILFNLILPVIFINNTFLHYGSLFVFPFIIFTSYAIYKHKLFNIKVASVGFVAFILTIFSFFNILYAKDTSQIVLDITFFIGILIGSITLIQSILKEVEQREELVKLNVNLNDLLKQRESLVHLVTHKVKGSFTHSKYIFAGMLDGMFGEINDEVKKRAQQGLESDNMGIETVDLVLNAANLEKGIVKYEMKKIDIKELVESTISDKKVSIETKGLKIETEIKDETYDVLGDPIWIKEVFNNLVENSIKYTKEGTLTVGLTKKDKKIIFYIKDTGVGITDEDKNNLFTEGGRGKDSVKINVDSTGYGLYSVKLIVEAHKGRVWAESGGEGKGTTFFVELDAV